MSQRVCTDIKCSPFYVREWETMVMGVFILVVVLYIMFQPESDYFHTAKKSYLRNGEVRQRLDPNHLSIEGMGEDLPVLPGAAIPLRGVSTSKHVEFAAIDSIADEEKEQPNESYPATSDDTLETLIR